MLRTQTKVTKPKQRIIVARSSVVTPKSDSDCQSTIDVNRTETKSSKSSRVVFVSLWNFTRIWDVLEPTILVDCLIMINTTPAMLFPSNEAELITSLKSFNLAPMILTNDSLMAVLKLKAKLGHLIFFSDDNLRPNIPDYGHIFDQLNTILQCTTVDISQLDVSIPSTIIQAAFSELNKPIGNHNGIIAILKTLYPRVLPIKKMINDASELPSTASVDTCKDRQQMSVNTPCVNEFGDNCDMDGFVWVDYSPF